MLKLLKSLLVFVFLVGVAIYATFFSDITKSLLGKHLPANGKSVLGISISQNEQNNVTNEVKKEASASANAAEKQIMQIKIGDIVNAFSRGQKIIKEISGLQSNLQEQLKKLGK